MRHKVSIGIKDLKKLPILFKEIQTGLEKAVDETANELTDNIMQEIVANYTIDENETEYSPTFFKRKDESKYITGVSGSQAVYHEYGTGTIGEKNPHPNKDNVEGLNPYNSGKKIRIASARMDTTKTGVLPGERYWTYKDGGEIIYTQGVASGKEVYNAVRKVTKKSTIREIFGKKVGEELSKL